MHTTPLDGSPLPFGPGTVLGGKFRVERVLGQGGMGVVVQAMHLQLEQRVALKFLLPSALLHPETVTRFEREARAAAKIRSEHVARVIDVGTLDTGSPYIVMEYLEGEDLSAHLKRRGALSEMEATSFLLQACEALAEAHAAGIVHRDLKPANLFLARYPDGTPCVKILDFGISKILGGSEGREFDMTRATAIMGSPYYMSPEQMRSARSVDARTDIWALGIILYELVTGRVPFDGDTMPELCARVFQDTPARIHSFTQTGSPGFEAVVLRCLEKDTSRRFQSIAELANALSPFAPVESQRSLDRVARLSGTPPSRSGGGAGMGAPVAVAASSAGSLTQTDFGHTARGQRGSRAVLLSTAIAVSVLAGLAAWLLRATPTNDGAAGVSHSAAEVAAPTALPPSPPQASAEATPSAAPAPASVSAQAKASAAPLTAPAPRSPKPMSRPGPRSPSPTPAAPEPARPNALDGRL